MITLAGHDHQAAVLGVGATRAGDEIDSSGTAEAIVRTVPPTLTGSERLALAAAGVTTDLSIQPDRWSLLGGTEGGLALQRALSLLGVGSEGLPDLDRAALKRASSRVTARVGLDGLTISGIRDDVTAADVWRSVVEAATDDTGRLHDAISGIAGPRQRLLVTGGWCHSAMVLAAKRARLGPLTVVDVAEPGTLGAATLAACAAGEATPAEPLGGRS